MNREILSYNLREIRQSKGLRLIDVAEKTGIHSSKISHYEVGRYTPSLNNLVRLADFYGESVDALLGRRYPH